MTTPTVPRRRVRLAREDRSISCIAEARVRCRVLAFLRGPGAGKPRGIGEIWQFAGLTAVLSSRDLAGILEAAVDRGELDAVDGVRAGNVGGNRKPYRGYALPPEGESGGAA